MRKDVPSHDGGRLFALGFLTLFLELALIRYLSGNIWNLGYFPNLVLLAVFIGMGVGFLAHQRISDQSSHRLFAGSGILLLLLTLFVLFFHPMVPGFGSWYAEIGGDLYFTRIPTSETAQSVAAFLVWFLAVTVIFVCISQRTAKLFRLFSPLHAYTLDIAGSCVGILCFMVLSWWRIPAHLWFLLLVPPFVFGSSSRIKGMRTGIAMILLCICAVAWFSDQRLSADRNYDGPLNVRWSPYQKVEFISPPGRSSAILVNGIPHQQMFDLETLRGAHGSIPYTRPYEDLKRRGRAIPVKVLVLGAGSGNDVAAALNSRVSSVDAVEIDPVIAELGRAYHPLQPYRDPRVRLFIDDGRAFLTRAREPYDLIVFALTDSLVKASPMSQLRLENYLFTTQAVRRAYDLLNESGQLVFYNFYRRPWLLEKMGGMIRNATHKLPRMLYQSSDFVMIAVEKNPSPGGSTDSPATSYEIPQDDWPFLYLKKRGIPPFYAYTMTGVCVFVAATVFYMGRPLRARRASSPADLRVSIAFLCMGIAFSLLETKSVIQFSLLFGTTWINNSLVFLSILLLILAANWTALWFRRIPFSIVYLLLCLSCFAALIYPMAHLLLVINPFKRFLIASLMTFLPIYFANLVFCATFRNQPAAEYVFGWNLIGAMLGGIVEYTSLAVGYNALGVWVILFYTLAFVLLKTSISRPPSPTHAAGS